jgi:hypothetical protein
MPSVPINRRRLAAAYALRGKTERAAAELAEARRLARDDLSNIAHLRAFPGAWWGAPKDPGPIRSHVFRRVAQGRDGGGVTRAVSPATLRG